VKLLFREDTAERMRFQTRLLLTYSLLAVMLAIIFGALFYRNNARYVERNAETTYDLVARRVSEQVESLFSSMDFVMVNLLSDADFKSALSSLAFLQREAPGNQRFFNEASDTLRQDLMIYSIHRDFHSAIVVNQHGDFFSSNFVDHVERRGLGDSMTEVDWFEEVKAANGRPVVIGPYLDPWGDPGIELYGLARSVRGPEGNLGVIAVQNPADDLTRLFTVSSSEYLSTFAWLANGDLLYAQREVEPELLSAYQSSVNDRPSATGFLKNELTGERELLAYSTSDFTGVTTAVVVNRALLLTPLRVTGWLTAWLTALIVLASVAYNWFSSRQLTKPLRHVQERLEQAELATLGVDEDALHANDEVAVMDLAFQRMKARLDESIRREIHSHTAWIQARLDSLQAQINPHFMFNALTVIASRGHELGDEEIGDLCDGIASMLRYSTATTDRDAPIRDELGHVNSYVFLMQRRLEHRLSVQVDVDHSLLDVRIPKIVLQQIVENSLNHGFQETSDQMKIEITGRAQDGRWWITVADNGRGFDKARVAAIDREIAAIRLEIAETEDDGGFAIGGLGLVNTYLRLHLFFRGDVDWRLENSDSGGAIVTIGGPMKVEATS